MALTPIEYDIASSILAIDPLVEFSIPDDDVDQINWIKGTPIAKADILAKQTELKAAYDGKDYARTRATAYPSIGDQLDMLWHAVDTGDWTAAKVKTTEFYTALKAVKDANPKP